MKKLLKNNILIFIYSFFLNTVLSLVIHIIMYKNIFTSISISHCFGLSFRLAYIEILLWLVSSLLGYGVIDTCLNSKKVNKKSVIAMILAILISILSILYISFSGLCFYDSGVKFKDNSSIFKVCYVDYEQVELYSIVGYYYSVPSAGNQANTYYEYKEKAYAISDGQGHYFEFGELKETSKDYEMLCHIAEQYDKDIKEIESVRNLW